MYYPKGRRLMELYDNLTHKFSGLQPISELLGALDLNSFNMLLLTYEDGGNLTMSVFDDNFVEVFFPDRPLSISIP